MIPYINLNIQVLSWDTFENSIYYIFDTLAGKAIGVVRDGLNDGSMREKLSAVDKYAKLKDTIGTEESSAESVEDIVDRIFKGVSTENLNVQINVGDRNDR